MQLADDTKLKFLSYGPPSAVVSRHGHACARLGKALGIHTPRARLDFLCARLPGLAGYPAFVLELVGALLLALGIAVRVTAALLIPVMIGALLVHLPNGWMFIAPNGGWECLAFLIGALLTQVLIGGGTLALRTHRQNAARWGFILARESGRALGPSPFAVASLADRIARSACNRLPSAFVARR